MLDALLNRKTLTKSFDKPQSFSKKSEKEVGELLVILILRTLKVFQYDKNNPKHTLFICWIGL